MLVVVVGAVLEVVPAVVEVIVGVVLVVWATVVPGGWSSRLTRRNTTTPARTSTVRRER